jgi:DNA-binding NtrC family response regulator
MNVKSDACVKDQTKPKAVLILSPFEEDRTTLRGIFDRSDWQLREAKNISEAMHLLTREQIPVVICESDLPVGDWKALLDALQLLPYPPQLIVSSRMADDRLWAEVLNLGGYDVQPIPFDPAAILRTAQLARSSCLSRWGKLPLALQVAS